MSGDRRSRSLPRAGAIVRRLGDGLRSLGSPQMADEIPPPPINVVPLNVPNVAGPINVAIAQNLENEIRFAENERRANAPQQGAQGLQPIPLLGRVAGLSSGLDTTSSSEDDRSRNSSRRSSRYSSRSRSGSYRARNSRRRADSRHRAEGRQAHGRHSRHSGREDRHSGSVGPTQPADTEHSQENMSAIVTMIKDLTQEIASIKNSQLRGVIDARLNSIESVVPPQLASTDYLFSKSKKQHLSSMNIRNLKDLKVILDYKFRPKVQSVCDWLRGFTSKVKVLASEIDPILYNILVVDNLNPESQEKLFNFLDGKPIDKITPMELHKIIITILGSNSTTNDRNAEFYGYTLERTNTPPTLSSLVHKVKNLAHAANVSKEAIYHKVLSLLPFSAQQELRLFVLSQRTTDPGFIPSCHEILSILSETASGINKKLEEKYKKKGIREVKTINLDQSELDSQHDEVVAIQFSKQVPLQNFSKPPPKNVNPNSYERQDNPRQTCLNCLQEGHHHSNCRFNNIACVLCGGNHPSPTCQIYKGCMPCVKACHWCSLLGNKLHHASTDCLTLKESQLAEKKMQSHSKN